MLDADIFQPLVLGLLAISLILSLASFATLGRLRKAMESGEPRGESPPPEQEAPQPAAASGWAAPATAEPEPAPSSGWAAPAAAEPEPAAAGWGEPAPAAAPAATTPEAAEPQPTPAPVQEEPQEQPFERDGRWWFRRGDELLVYDEQAQQWVPAPQQPSGWAGGGAPAGQPAAAAAEPEGGHWKCPTCGAINGSTATTCRMCFTPRA